MLEIKVHTEVRWTDSNRKRFKEKRQMNIAREKEERRRKREIEIHEYRGISRQIKIKM